MGLPMIQVGLGFLQAFEAQALEGRSLGVTNSRLYFTLSIRMPHPAGQGHGTIMVEDIAIEGIE